MNLKRPPLLLVCLSLIFFLVNKNLIAQDIHFTQFGQTPLLLNPAETGLMDADWRLSAGHRHQWQSLGRPYVTSYFGYDKQVFIKKHHFSIGGILLHDASSPLNLNVNKALLSGAYHWHAKMHTVHLGIQGGVVNSTVNLMDVTFPQQYDRGTGNFNNSLPNGEGSSTQSVMYSDINAGMMYSYRFKKHFIRAGVAIHHINQPQLSFFGSPYQMRSRKVFTSKFDWRVGRKITLAPLAGYMFLSKASEMVGGLYGYYHLTTGKNKQSVYGGVVMRNGINRNADATSIVVGAILQRVDVGLSYDITVSDLSQANQLRGGFEITLVYKGATALLQKNSIPCERY